MYQIEAAFNFRPASCSKIKNGIDWEIKEKLSLRCKDKKIATSLKTNNSGQQTIASLKISTDEQNETEPKICLIITTTVTIPPHHISFVPLKVINQAINTRFPSEALLEIEENPFLTIEQPELVLMPTVQRLGSQVPNIYMAVLWHPIGQNLILKWNMTIGYIKESEHGEKWSPGTTKNSGKTIKVQPPKTSTFTVGEVIEISHDKLPPMPKNQHLCSTTISIPNLK